MQFVLNEKDSWSFARLSGDFNPLHVDPVAARRLQFGSTICHGVHQLLKALDLAIEAGWMLPAQIGSLSTVFNSALRTGASVELLVTIDAKASLGRIVASSAGVTLFTARFALANAVSQCQGPADAEPEKHSAPRLRNFPAADEVAAMAGTVPLRLNRALACELFPTLTNDECGTSLIADLIATTRIVGMECPGLHSIYSELKLRRRNNLLLPTSDPVNMAAMPFVAEHVDARFRSMRIGVVGAVFEGTLHAFFRAPPVSQVRLDELYHVVAPDRFVGQRALVVGGSRGLGEMVSKILLAGGAKVTLTYARGQSDAERIKHEISASGRTLSISRLDVTAQAQSKTCVELSGVDFSHIYYFATPQISKSPDGTWNAALFDEYCSFYVHGFVDLVRWLSPKDHDAAPLTVLYPSTAFLDTPPKGFAEYCAAKAAGEAVCDHLGKDAKLRIAKPRMPRLQTDQNNSFLGAAGEPPLSVMLNLVQELHPDRREGRCGSPQEVG